MCIFAYEYVRMLDLLGNLLVCSDITRTILIPMQTVLTRINSITRVAYKDDPTIFAWELINEPRCQSDVSGALLQVSLFKYYLFFL